MHVGHMNAIDIDYTVKRRRTIAEMHEALPMDAPERPYFSNAGELSSAFPEGRFNCWGVPSLAEPSFNKTKVGDLVLIVPYIGIHGGGITHVGVVRAKCPVRCHAASRLLWPRTPDARVFPLIFFFHSETGFRGWFEFLDDVGIKKNWDPRGWYRPVLTERFKRWGGPAGYLEFLRSECRFGSLPPAT